MTWLRPAFAILIALFGSTADAGSQAVPRKYQAGFYLESCKDFLAGRSNFLSGRCVGAVEVLSELGSDNKSFCPPETINNIEQVRVIVTYIEGLPKRVRWQKLGRAKLETNRLTTHGPLAISGLAAPGAENRIAWQAVHLGLSKGAH
jgi:hypothetical protein